jgi:hypothetical protein
MIDPTLYVRSLESDLRRKRAIDEKTCQSFSQLPFEKQQAFAKALAFLGCTTAFAVLPTSDLKVKESDRLQAARLMLLKLSVDMEEPIWSSWMLEKMLDAIVTTPGGSISDLLHALFDILGEFKVQLTATVANFIKQISISCFTRYRKSYDAADFSWMIQHLREGWTPAQAYLALYSIPEDLVNRCRQSILNALASTSFYAEAVNNLGEGSAP